MKSRLYVITSGLLCLSAFFCNADQTAALTVKSNLNEPIRLTKATLQQSKMKAGNGDTDAQSAIAVLDLAASKLLGLPAFTIVNKSILPASGNKHDYFSFGPYWWPDQTKADGKPWIKIDGKINPSSRQADQDKVVFKQFSDAVSTLSIAYFFTDKTEYAHKAASLIRAWFLDEATLMNPHLNYAQGIPGITDGRGIGIIDMWYLYRVIDGILLIQPSGALTKEDNSKLQLWFSQYLNWLVNSRLGIEERNTQNNHATFYALQTAIVAIYVGEPAVAQQQVKHAITLMQQQIAVNGQQPHELKRTRPFHYSVFNLQAFVGLASIAPQVGVDLWQQTNAESPKLKAAITYVLTKTAQSLHWGGKQEHTIALPTLIPVLPDLIKTYALPKAQYQAIFEADKAMANQCALLFGLPHLSPKENAEFHLCAY
jgi:hypothetical protein